jgi:catechol 2,3-dioxygenase-like lactoylglutathione lyase family enzyme
VRADILIAIGAQRTARPTFLRSHAFELSRHAVENRHMKTRCFDHIDLRVKDMEVARKFYGKFLPKLGFAHESPGDDFHTFFAGGSDRPLEFFSFDEDKNIAPTTRASRFGRTRAKKWIGLRNSCATLAGKTLRGRRFARTTARVTTPSSSKTPTAINSKFAAARSRYLRVDVNTEIKDHERRAP